MMVVGLISTGGATVLAAGVLGRRKDPKGSSKQSSNQNDQEFPSPEGKENEA
jgi:hypothetical protein